MKIIKNTPLAPLKRGIYKKTPLKRGIQTLFTVLIFAVVALIVISILPIPGNYKLLIVQSGSMEPAIKTGSVVVVKPAENYKAGDIITFEDRGKDKTTTHRILDLEVISGQTQYITKGDANNAEDSSRVSESKIIGKVLTSIPYAGYILATAKEPIGFILLVIVPCAIIILEEMGKIWKEVKLSKKNKHTPSPSQEGNDDEEKEEEDEDTPK